MDIYYLYKLAQVLLLEAPAWRFSVLAGAVMVASVAFIHWAGGRGGRLP